MSAIRSEFAEVWCVIGAPGVCAALALGGLNELVQIFALSRFEKSRNT